MSDDSRYPGFKKIGQALKRSVNAAEWLEESDFAAVALAFKYADALDNDTGGKSSYLGPNLQKTLHSLGLTPESRINFTASGDGAQEVDELQAMRARRGA